MKYRVGQYFYITDDTAIDLYSGLLIITDMFTKNCTYRFIKHVESLEATVSLRTFDYWLETEHLKEFIPSPLVKALFGLTL